MALIPSLGTHSYVHQTQNPVSRASCSGAQPARCKTRWCINTANAFFCMYRFTVCPQCNTGSQQTHMCSRPSTSTCTRYRACLVPCSTTPCSNHHVLGPSASITTTTLLVSASHRSNSIAPSIMRHTHRVLVPYADPPADPSAASSTQLIPPPLIIY